MDKESIQWLISLSLLSLLGPKSDIDKLVQSGFYKKSGSDHPVLTLDISLNDTIYSKYENEFNSFLSKMNVSDKESYHNKVKELISGSTFSKNLDKMMTLGKLMSYEERESKKTIIINKHPYNKDFFLKLMKYEFNWPKYGLYSYDIANAIMLIRIGVEQGYLIEEDQLVYLEEIYNKFKGIFVDYKTFSSDCCIGRNLHIIHLKSVRSVAVIEDQNQVQSIAYYGLWQYL